MMVPSSPDLDREAVLREGAAASGLGTGGAGAIGSRRARRLSWTVLLDGPFDRPRADPSAGHEGAGGLARGEGADFIEPIAVEDLGQQPHAAAAALPEIGGRARSG